VGARERSWRQLAEEAELKLEQGDVPEAIALYENAVVRLGRRSDRVLRASVLYNLAAAQAQGGRGQEAGTSLRRARDLLRAAPDGHDGALLSTVLSRLGTLELDLGDLGAAREAHEQAIVLRERAGDQQGLPTAYVNLGLTLKDEGRLTEAQAYLSRGLDLASANGLDRVAGHALTGLGLVHELLNELIPATVSYQQALAAYQSAADEENEATIYHNLGVVLDKRGDQERALAWHQAVLVPGAALYLDGTLVASSTKGYNSQFASASVALLGTGETTACSDVKDTFTSGNWSYFSGSLADLSVYQNELPSAATVAAQYAAETTLAGELNTITSPAGRTEFAATYDTVNDRVATITDGNGGTWTYSDPVNTASSAAYDTAVMGGGCRRTSGRLTTPPGRTPTTWSAAPLPLRTRARWPATPT
jgi:Flp pilus assembly protein TadD